MNKSVIAPFLITMTLIANAIPAAEPEFPDQTLHYFARIGDDIKLYKLLQTGKCDVNKPDALGSTPLHYAAQNGHRECLELLLHQKEVNMDAFDEHGFTPLHWSVMYDHPDCARLLLAHNVDIRLVIQKGAFVGKTVEQLIKIKGHKNFESFLKKEGNKKEQEINKINKYVANMKGTLFHKNNN
ncbi:ankyrin repeat domain-containing protein [bacterium]|nr:MAG: ankyrin repeat domain-containing protein [bacterium]